MRSCSSAASAWRLSGLRRVRASRSTSSARSRLSCVRSSLSWARRRRLRCLPSPAASSISIRRSLGLDVTISPTRPWETTECISLPRPVSDRISITSVSRQRAPLMRYSPSPLRLRRRTIEISPTGRSIRPAALSSTTSTSASLRACTPWPPAKITSCIDWPRTAIGDCSPSAHSTASVMLDLPLPLGPTITATPGLKVSRVRSGNDLKPRSVIELRCIPGRMIAVGRRGGPASRSTSQGLECGLGRGLFGVLLRAPRPAGERLAPDHRHAPEGPLVRRALLRGDLVDDHRAAAGEPLLQGGLEVGRVRQRALDLGRERLHHRIRHRLVAELQVAGADHGLDHRRQHPLRAGELLRRRAGELV